MDPKYLHVVSIFSIILSIHVISVYWAAYKKFALGQYAMLSAVGIFWVGYNFLINIQSFLRSDFNIIYFDQSIFFQIMK